MEHMVTTKHRDVDVDEEAARDEVVFVVQQRVDEMHRDLQDVIEALTQMFETVNTLDQRTADALDHGGGAGALAVADIARHWTRTPRTLAEWDDLVAWVDLWADTHTVTAMPACWPAHERLVLELVALRDSWRAAAIAATAPKPNGVLHSWYRYDLPHTIDLLARHTQCVNGHTPDPMPATTDRQWVPDGLPESVQQPEPVSENGQFSGDGETEDTMILTGAQAVEAQG